MQFSVVSSRHSVLFLILRTTGGRSWTLRPIYCPVYKHIYLTPTYTICTYATWITFRNKIVKLREISKHCSQWLLWHGSNIWHTLSQLTPQSSYICSALEYIHRAPHYNTRGLKSVSDAMLICRPSMFVEFFCPSNTV